MTIDKEKPSLFQEEEAIKKKCVPFCEWITEKIIENGSSQAKLAREIGVNRSTVNLWKKGARIPSPEMKEKIAESPLFSSDSDKDDNVRFLLWCCHFQELMEDKQLLEEISQRRSINE